jgi:lysozyme family protein
MTFDEAFHKLIGHEGGFQKIPADAGNWANGVLKGTKWGISARSYPTLDIESLTLDDAKRIYRRDFWDRCGCDVLPSPVRFDVFDTAVHSGQGRAVVFLQRAVGTTQDGILGPRTLAAAQSMDPYRLSARYNGHRLDFLNDNPENWRNFGRGWAQRIADNLKAA